MFSEPDGIFSVSFRLITLEKQRKHENKETSLVVRDPAASICLCKSSIIQVFFFSWLMLEYDGLDFIFS